MYTKKTEKEIARENLVTFIVVMFMIAAAIFYMWAIDQYWPNIHQVGMAFRFFVCAPSWALFALAIYIAFTKIK